MITSTPAPADDLDQLLTAVSTIAEIPTDRLTVADGCALRRAYLAVSTIGRAHGLTYGIEPAPPRPTAEQIAAASAAIRGRLAPKVTT